MKYCPTCRKEFDEDVIRFCTIDGTPLVEDKKPSFNEKLPSESSSLDDDGDTTIIRRKKPSIPSDSNASDVNSGESSKTSDSNRMVIPTTGEQSPTKNAVRPKESAVQNKPIPPNPENKSNTAIIVVMTMLGTILLLLGVFVIYWMLTNQTLDDDANSNLEVNQNTDINADLNEDFGDVNLDELNLNINSNLDNSNMDLNLNLNINTKTPTPTKTPSPSPSPSATPNTNSNTNVNANISTPTTTPTPVKTPKPTPVKTPTKPPVKTPTPNTNTNKPVNAGTLNGRAVRLPTPAYPSSARKVKASGKVTVSVTLDTSGNVTSAKAISGHALLRSPAENAARRSKFRPVSVNGTNRRAIGTVVYNFVN